jgi:hypothetical protein
MSILQPVSEALLDPPPYGDGLADHLVPLPGGSWALWRSVVLRGAGFPARGVLAFASPACAAAADRVLRSEQQLAAAQRSALAAVHAALDHLRATGMWDDKDRRRPLMKAMQALTGSRLPKEVQEPACAAAFDSLRAAAAALAAERDELAGTCRSEISRLSEEIARVAGDDRFREAVTWQNRHAAATALAELVGKPAATAARTSQRRQHEELVANYLQRYCVKNDSIGFFGPVAFATLGEAGAPVALRCGPELVERREVYFEVWCIAELAQAMARDPALRPWLAPRLKASFHLEGDILHSPFGEPSRLTPEKVRLLAACRAGRAAREIAAELVADPGVALATEEEVYELLDALCRARILTWTLEARRELHPDRTLAAKLQRIGDDGPRLEALAALEELQGARDGVVRAAGDAQALESAMRELEGTFTRLTGSAARHHLGQMYAARGLVYEDCRRSVDAQFGSELTARLGPPLTLVLRGARWVAGEITRAVHARLRTIHAELSRQAGSTVIDSQIFLARALPAIFLKRDRDDCFVEVEREYQARWSKLLEAPSAAGPWRLHFAAAALADGFDAVFDRPRPAWTLSRYFSPDVMIAAAGVEAFQRGDFELVLGEIHAGNTLLWSCFLSQHQAPEKVAAALAIDSGDAVVVLPQINTHSSIQRLNLGVELPWIYHYELGNVLPGSQSSQSLAAGEVVIEETGEGLVARTRDNRLRFDPIDLFSPYLTQECSSILGAILPPARHLPRLTFDRLVISRERWRFAVAELELATLQDPVERLVAVRRWARDEGLPRFCFYKLTTERKPCYLDLESPIYVDTFARLVRAARESGSGDESVAVTEMVPRIDQTWLSDAEGNLYTCELRIAALDRLWRTEGEAR